MCFRNSLAVLICCLLFVAGCHDNRSRSAMPITQQESAGVNGAVASSSTRVAVVEAPRAVEETLEAAYKEYLAAYDRYVKLLRESGPQTIDTLNALAEYQRKYQIYQMMLSDAAQVR